MSRHKKQRIIITRHASLIEYLKEIGLADGSEKIIAHASVEDVQRKHVIGVIPSFLAVHAASVTEVGIVTPKEMRGKELSLEDLRKYATTPIRYIAKEIPLE